MTTKKTVFNLFFLNSEKPLEEIQQAYGMI